MSHMPQDGVVPCLSCYIVAALAVILPILSHTPPGSGLENDRPEVLIEQCSENEIAALKSPQNFHYFEHLEWKWGTETREVIETSGGRADKVIQFNDQPLAPDQRAKQDQRLRKLLSDNKVVRHEMEEQRAEAARRIRMLRAFASAFTFQAKGEEAGLLKFSFRPNGSFTPEDRETAVYRGMEGTVWIEPEQKRLVRIDGVLTKDVSFGWGIFGRLHKGGHYFIEQTQVAPGIWRTTSLDLELKMRVFLQSTRILRRERNSQFEPTPQGTTYKEAIEQLLQSAKGPNQAGLARRSVRSGMPERYYLRRPMSQPIAIPTASPAAADTPTEANGLVLMVCRVSSTASSTATFPR